MSDSIPDLQAAPARLRVAKLSELPLGTNKAVKVNGVSILLCRVDAGLFAVENRCTHQLAALEGGRMRGRHLFCPKHGARFDMGTGATAGTLARDPIKTYSVHLDESENIELEWPQ